MIWLFDFQVVIIIKTTELYHCSPAAISHCGVLYHHSDNIGWNAYFHSWLKKIDNKKISKEIEKLANEYLDRIIEFPFKSLEESEIFFTSRMHCIASFCKVMGTLLKQVKIEVFSFFLSFFL